VTLPSSGRECTPGTTRLDHGDRGVSEARPDEHEIKSVEHLNARYLPGPVCPATHGENWTDTRRPIGGGCWSLDTDSIT
jgi:hypothetical protein